MVSAADAGYEACLHASRRKVHFLSRPGRAHLWHLASQLPEAHRLFDVEFHARRDIVLGGSAEFQSRSHIDATNAAWVSGYALLHVRLGCRFEALGAKAEVLLSSRNILGTRSIAFTEPDPDGNSYQPAPDAEMTLSLRLLLGEN